MSEQDTGKDQNNENDIFATLIVQLPDDKTRRAWVVYLQPKASSD